MNIKYSNITTLKYITIAILAIVMYLFLASSCKDKGQKVTNLKYDPEKMPSMITDSVYTLISDSGITRYKLLADKWEIFDKAEEPFWFFPYGIYLERFDSKFNVEATIVSDTAWNYTSKKLWRLKGHVVIQNLAGDVFKSDEFFWDQSTAKVYSNTLIQIKKGDLELKGSGFESNQEMTDYRVFNPFDGKLPIENNSQGVDNEIVSVDEKAKLK